MSITLRPAPRPTAVGSAAAPTEASAASEASTRQRVLQLVASAGPVAAPQLSAELHLTSAGIRRHLGVLEADGQIAVHEGAGLGPARRGRPARRYIVTAHGQAALSNSYSELAAQAMRYLAELAGPDAVEAFATTRARGLEGRYRTSVTGAGDGVAARASALSRALGTDGYAASTRSVPGMAAIQLCQGHCPVQQIATEFPQLCEAETQAFSRLLGVHVQRLSTLANGGHVCTTNIPTPGPTAESSTAERSTADRSTVEGRTI